MFDAFEVVERLHELLWYLADARSRPEAAPLHDEVDGLRDRVSAAARSPHDVDVTVLQSRCGALLDEVSGLVRAGGPSLRHADLAGRDLREEDLYAADLRGAVLIGADLRGVDLGPADLLGADLRDARVAGADLSQALFLTRLQVRAAR
nr:pentapeptide repeat-containing protein [Nocardioides mangrovicus]